MHNYYRFIKSRYSNIADILAEQAKKENLTIRIIENFLPSPDKLVLKEEVVKVTIGLSKSSLAFFKKEAKKNHTKYQKMIRSVVDGYARGYSKGHV